MPRFVDDLTGQVLSLDMDPEFAKECGYSILNGGSVVTAQEWESAQDPVYLERIRQDKMHGKKPWNFYNVD